MRESAINILIENDKYSYFELDGKSNIFTPILRYIEALEIKKSNSSLSFSNIFEHLDYEGNYINDVNVNHLHKLYFEKTELEKISAYYDSFFGQSNYELMSKIDINNNKYYILFNQQNPYYCSMDYSIPLDKAVQLTKRLERTAEKYNYNFDELMNILQISQYQHTEPIKEILHLPEIKEIMMEFSQYTNENKQENEENMER